MRNIDITSLILQMLSLDILFKDYNNIDLMQELQHQDKNYFERIIKQNEEIINLLKERGDNDGRNSDRENK
jgi:hypothetical protein